MCLDPYKSSSNWQYPNSFSKSYVLKVQRPVLRDRGRTSAGTRFSIIVAEVLHFSSLSSSNCFRFRI